MTTKDSSCIIGYKMADCPACGGFSCFLKDENRGQPPGFTCEHCGMTSYNPNDLIHMYCGNCHHFCSDENLFKAIFEERDVQDG